MTLNELKLPQKNQYPRRHQISSPVEPELFERFQSFTKKFGHGSKRILIETALRNLLDEIDKK